MKNIILAALCGVLFVACSATYTQESLSDDFNISEFRNAYSTEQTDSLFKVFNDKDLAHLARSALSQNSDIFIYETRIKSAQSQAKLAIAKQMPNIDASASYNFNGDSAINTSLMASWELDIFGKYASAKSAQDEHINIAKSNLKYFQISLISDIALSYFNLKYMQQNIILTKERIINYREMLSIMDSMYKGGLVSFSDFLERKMDLQNEEQSLNTLLNDYEAKKNEIRVLINERDYDFKDANITAQIDKSEHFFATSQHLKVPDFSVNLSSPANIILNRPDISAQIASLNAAVHNLNSAKAQMYPTLNLGGSLGKAFLQPAEFVYNILASIAMPLFSRFEIYENIKISDYMRLEAYYTLQKGVNTAFSEIENALYSLQTNKENFNNSIAILSQNREVLELLEQSFKLGLIDSAEYLLAINNHLAMVKSSNTAHFNAISAIIYLYRAIGGNESDINFGAESSGNSVLGMQFRACKNFQASTDSSLVESPKIFTNTKATPQSLPLRFCEPQNLTQNHAKIAESSVDSANQNKSFCYFWLLPKVESPLPLNLNPLKKAISQNLAQQTIEAIAVEVAEFLPNLGRETGLDVRERSKFGKSPQDAPKSKLSGIYPNKRTKQ